MAWAKKEGKEPKKGTQASPAQAKLSPDSWLEHVLCTERLNHPAPHFQIADISWALGLGTALSDLWMSSPWVIGQGWWSNWAGVLPGKSIKPSSLCLCCCVLLFFIFLLYISIKKKKNCNRQESPQYIRISQKQISTKWPTAQPMLGQERTQPTSQKLPHAPRPCPLSAFQKSHHFSWHSVLIRIQLWLKFYHLRMHLKTIQFSFAWF